MRKSNFKTIFLSLLLVMAFVITMVPMNTFAAESDGLETVASKETEVVASSATYGNLTYTIVNNEAAITRCDTFATGSIQIPSELDGYPVTRIYGDAFINCTKVKYIYIPSTVAKIESGAFSRISNLEGIYVDEDNQNYCAENGVLFNKDKTSLLQAPRTLTEYVVPSSIIQIASKAFNGCENLSNVTIGDNVTSIGRAAFEECTSLVSIRIPNSVKTIDKATFYRCWNLSNVEFGNSVTKIDDNAFYGCNSLTKITLPDGVTNINRAFNACTNLTSIELGGVNSLEYRAFWGCSKLSSITIGSGFKLVGPDAFEGCDGLINVYYYGTEEQWNKVTICDGNFYLTERATVHYLHVCQWDEGTITTSPTCTKEGERTYQCEGCDTIKTEVILKLDHSYNTITTGATLNSNGSKEEKCSTCGKLKSTTTIYKISSVTLSTTAYTYNGKTKSPSVVVEDSKGNKLTKDEDYTVTYGSAARSAIGRYSAKVAFKGNYSGSETLYFIIGPKNPSSVSAKLYGYDDVRVSWRKVSGASGYKVYYKKSTASTWSSKTTTGTSVKLANLSDGVKYDIKVVTYKTVKGNKCYNAGKSTSIYTLKKVAGVKVAKSGSKVKVFWKNISGETGYQISKSTKKSGTSIVSTYKTSSGNSKTISATKGKTYYYKVRAYKVVDGKKIYGIWSSVIKYKR